MKTVLIAVALIALCSCGQKTLPASSEAAEKPAEKQNSGTITLDEAAQRRAHIEVAPVASKELAESVSAPGQMTVNEDKTWRVGAVVSGKIDNLTARVGDLVREGQVLGRIHSHEAHDTRAAYQQASVELQRARSAETHAKRLRDRAQRLLELKAGSRQDVETAEAELRNAQAAIDKAESEQTKERIHMTDILHIPLNDGNASHGEEDDVPIFGSAAGVVMQRKATVGSVVSAGDEIFTISDTSSLWMIASANELNLAKLRPGQTVRIGVRAWPDREFNGRILKLGEQLDPTTRTLQVRILVPNAQGLLKPEMYATAELPEGGKRGVLQVPEEAIQDINGVSAVFVRKSATEFEPRTVKTGRRANGEAEITEGIKAGETVVIKGGFMLKSQLMRRAIEE
ncbi:MAG: efflux RND transporter periplasmic adaptor subunit [Bryobacteraceae bacterium]|nr:efflux RND transporter periplasmic adaptor subunit [Bryobacteraceae bacterium]